MGSFSPGSHIDSGLQIDNVQSFFKVIGNNSSLWQLLLGREVIHFIRGREKVNAVNNESLALVIYPSNNTTKNHPFRYPKERLVKEFGDIEPPIKLEEFIKFDKIDSLPSLEKIIELIQTDQAERQEAERQEIERQEIERREAERREAERREAIRREAERREAERQQAERREAERRALLKSLKEQFEQDFLNAYSFYQANCSEHISVEKYHSEKSSEEEIWQRIKDRAIDHFTKAVVGFIQRCRKLSLT
jgi:hypothetical protein